MDGALRALLQEHLQTLSRASDEVRAMLNAQLEAEQIADATTDLLWGKKVSTEFKAGVLWIEDQLGLNANWLMACMHFETGGTFSAKTKNLAGSSGLGLIQFMKSTHAGMLKQYPNLRNLAPTHADLAKLSDVQQLSFVYYYFKSFGKRLDDWSLEDTYMAILYPAAIGKQLAWAMPWAAGSLAYKQNSGLDLNKDEVITKAEACAGVRKSAELGLQFKG